MNLHTRIFRASLKDAIFVADMKAVGESLPTRFCTDELKKAIYGSNYAGWLLGKYGPVEGRSKYEEAKVSKHGLL